MRRNVDMHTHLKLFYLIEAHFVNSKNLIIKFSKFLMIKEVCVYIFILEAGPRVGSAGRPHCVTGTEDTISGRRIHSHHDQIRS